VVSTQLKQLPKGLLQYKVQKENLVVPSSFSASADWTRIQMSDILKWAKEKEKISTTGSGRLADDRDNNNNNKRKERKNDRRRV
jgi:protein involved in sex pheromone biosynthesis